MAAVLWLILGVALIAAEVLSGAFVLVMLGVAGLAAAAGAALGADLAISAAVFVLAAGGGIVLVRPALMRHMHSVEPVKTNIEALVGERATVIEPVNADSGRVKIGGDLWSARAFDETEVLEVGRSVTVMSISGATAVVWGGP
ncbi:MAG TPA: NfeD family protein [Pseudonocardiaceae bacterium]|jgi:membrane protein implicated in regulation of membrane protease activity|nr:NfeD family protein [Pseudonocardiaceae bacterium]